MGQWRNFPRLLMIAAVFFYSRAISAQASDPMPTTMAQCEPDSCGTWSFQGKQGIGRWTTGPIANLTIEHFDANTVSIRREDTTGVGQGIKGLYTGTRKGDHIDGTFTWTWPGHTPYGKVDWHATIQHLPEGYNTTWRAQNATTWTIPAGSKRFNLNGTWQHNSMVNGVKNTFRMQIEESGNNISIVSHDQRAANDGLTFQVGQQVSDSVITAKELNVDELKAGKTVWFQDNITILDPDHLLTQNGVLLFRVSNPGPDDAVCDSENTSHTQPVYSFFRGQVAFLSHNYQKAFCWIRIGAVEGDAQSQGVFAMMLHEGVGAPKDFPQAFIWAQKSASQGNITGETILSELYQKGDGTAPDAKKAESLRRAVEVAKRRKNEEQWATLLNTRTPSGLTPMEAMGLFFKLEGAVEDAEQDYRSSGRCAGDHPGSVTSLSGLSSSAADVYCH